MKKIKLLGIAIIVVSLISSMIYINTPQRVNYILSFIIAFCLVVGVHFLLSGGDKNDRN